MDARRKRLIYRCQHRGMKENDFLLGRFAERHAEDLDDGQMDHLETLLEAPENDVYNWITGKEPVPAAHDHDVMAWLKRFNGCP